MRGDPRYYQITVLTLLLLYGLVGLDFEITAALSALTLGSVLVTQYIATRVSGLNRFDPKSALISGLSLCLLLRTNYVLVTVAIACVTIASKFVIRWNGKHVFNPTNFGIALALLSGQAWVSPGQWGNVAWFGFLMACLGGLVVYRSARSDVTCAFLAFHIAILVGRALWLGQPLSIPLHQIESGAVLLFSFFMISDPKTTPDSRAGRILFALLVALGAGTVHFILYRTNGLIWSLALFSTIVPLIDKVLRGRRYEWTTKGAFHETTHDRGRSRARLPGGEPVGSRVLRVLRRESGHEALQ